MAVDRGLFSPRWGRCRPYPKATGCGGRALLHTAEIKIAEDFSMPSSFSWLDYSEQHRRQMLDVIDLFREQETRDELGIGAVRDAFADMLFPGTSTIQTRARYFLFVPWIYRQLEGKRVPSEQMRAKARKAEVALIYALLGSDDTAGLLGKQAKESLQRLPSNVYWQGLRVLGICLYPGSQDQYHRSLDAFYRRLDRADREAAADAAGPQNWHPGLPPVPDDFPDAASFRLEAAESRYLRDRILARASGKLFAFLIDNDRGAADVAFPWEHPLFAEFPSLVREQLDHARNFSEAIHGAAYLYNLLLAEKRGSTELTDQYRDAIAEWAELVEGRGAALRDWDRRRFWQIVIESGARVTPQTKLFIDAWLEIAVSSSVSAAATGEAARRLIGDRERALKRGLSRLDNARALELWSGAAGTAALDYRWPRARVVLEDVQAGLSGGD